MTLDACPSCKAVSHLLLTDELKVKVQCMCHFLQEGFPDEAFPKAPPAPLRGCFISNSQSSHDIMGLEFCFYLAPQENE